MRTLLATMAALCAASGAAAQRGTEWQAGGVTAFSSAAYAGAGLGWARRARRVRVALVASAGVLDSAVAGRGELLLGYLLTPARRRGVGLYAAGGIALIGSASGRAERLVALVGIERAPAGRHGWFAELGVGGGVRLAAGWRWRGLRR